MNFMIANAFVDTNILLYAISDEPADLDKSRVARTILGRKDIGFSVQVLQEFYVNAVRRPGKKLPHDLAESYLNVWMEHPIQPMTTELMRVALQICDRYMVSYWDAAVIAAAQALKATTLFTEDLQHGQRFGSVRVVNPFK